MRLYLLIRAVAGFAMASAFTLQLVYQAQIAGLGPLELVLAGTVFEVVIFAAQVPTGVLADLHSRKWSVIIGYALIGSGTLVEGLVPAFPAILAGSALMGVGYTCVEGAEEAWVAGELGDGASRAFTRGAQVSQAATIAGIVASVGLASMELRIPLLVGGGLLVLLAAVLVVVMRESPFEKVGAPREHLSESIREVRRRPALWFLMAAVASTAFAAEGIDRLTQLHFTEAFGTPLVWFGVISIGAMFAAIVLTQLADGSGMRGLVILQAGAAVSALALATSEWFWLAAAASVLLSAAREAARPTMITWVTEHTEPGSRATVLSFLGQTDAAGELAGGPPLGLTAERFGIRVALLGAAGALAVAVPFLRLALARRGVTK
ncbi:MFS transporter [Herbidospora sp. NBRC 101105]|uniref:MFS transporter n=1 Tax=Herbidospora sp. NBRC 101105 TaxID=3032195 RepID=UPI0024A38DCC|nr:MFS transporter [Herbidospora sp. NBRC 101105]GLX95322.1 MFS transporter [Herbidospora sp. NBRC 101105]